MNAVVNAFEARTDGERVCIGRTAYRGIRSVSERPFENRTGAAGFEPDGKRSLALAFA